MTHTEFLNQIENKLEKNYNLSAKAYYKAAISGKKEDYLDSANKEFQFQKIFTDKKIFQEIKHYLKKSDDYNSQDKRTLKKLFLNFQTNQVSEDKIKKITDLQNTIEQTLNNFRAKVENKKYSDNEIENILRDSKDLALLENIWKAHKKVGNLIQDDLLKLIKLRNDIAKEQGYSNFHEMSLCSSEITTMQVDNIFNELDNLTKKEYGILKSEIDIKIAKNLNIDRKKLMPWHFQNRFFQEAPKLYDLDLDSIYESIDIEETTKSFFMSHGLGINDINSRSSLYEKENKNQHAFMINLDRKKADVRVLCNLRPNAMWMNTNLHEFGHAIYEKHIDKSMNWTLIEPAHIFITEAIAMMYGRFASNPDWIKDNIVIDTNLVENIEETKENDQMNNIKKYTSKIARLEQLVFSRWVQVMYNFEKQLYENPEQHLNALWWDMVEKYQLINRPKNWENADWASKYHFVGAQCYYHNYLLGEILASQLYNFISKNITKSKSSFTNKKEVGEFLKNEFFKYGSLYQWNELIKKATGEGLTAKYYANDFINQ